MTRVYACWKETSARIILAGMRRKQRSPRPVWPSSLQWGRELEGGGIKYTKVNGNDESKQLFEKRIRFMWATKTASTANKKKHFLYISGGHIKGLVDFSFIRLYEDTSGGPNNLIQYIYMITQLITL